MIDIRILKGLEYGKKLYELEGELYGLVSCSYGIFEKTVGYGFAV